MTVEFHSPRNLEGLPAVYLSWRFVWNANLLMGPRNPVVKKFLNLVQSTIPQTNKHSAEHPLENHGLHVRR